MTVYPALVAGLLILVRRRNPGGDRAGVIDSLIITVGIALLSWVFLVAPNIHLSGLTSLEKAVSAAYPLGDILLLAAAIRLAVDKGKRAPAFYLLVASIVSLLAVDSAYTYALLTDAYNHQLSYDVGWIAYYLLGVRRLYTPPCARWTNLRSISARGSLLSPRAAHGSLPDRARVRFAQEVDNPDVLVLIVASAALFVLVVTRMAGLVRQEERTARRELALRRAGVELVAAAGHQRVNEAAISAVCALTESPVSVRLFLLGRKGVTVAASSQEAGEWPVSRDAYPWLRESAKATTQLPFEGVPEKVRSELHLSGGQTVLFLPLSVREEVKGLLVLCSPVRIPRELVDSLESLASQVSLAVEGTTLAEDLHRRQSEARFRSLVAHSSDLITVLDSRDRSPTRPHRWSAYSGTASPMSREVRSRNM